MFVWKKEYETGIENIDLQHQKLFELGSDIFNIINVKDGLNHYSEIMKILSDLGDYVQYHFSYEEDYMETIGYSGLDDHKKLHKKLTEKILSIQSENIDGEQKTVLIVLLDFVADWIGHHILQDDFKYVELEKADIV